MDCNKPETFETNTRLTTLPLLSGNGRSCTIDRLDVGSAQETPVCFTAVDDQQTLNELVIKHRLKRLKVKVGTSPVTVGTYGFRRLNNNGFEIGFISTNVDCSAKDCHSVFRRRLIVFEPCKN